MYEGLPSQTDQKAVVASTICFLYIHVMLVGRLTPPYSQKLTAIRFAKQTSTRTARVSG